jgi:hypothetical protein
LSQHCPDSNLKTASFRPNSRPSVHASFDAPRLTDPLETRLSKLIIQPDWVRCRRAQVPSPPRNGWRPALGHTVQRLEALSNDPRCKNVGIDDWRFSVREPAGNEIRVTFVVRRVPKHEGEVSPTKYDEPKPWTAVILNQKANGRSKQRSHCQSEYSAGSKLGGVDERGEAQPSYEYDGNRERERDTWLVHGTHADASLGGSLPVRTCGRGGGVTLSGGSCRRRMRSYVPPRAIRWSFLRKRPQS